MSARSAASVTVGTEGHLVEAVLGVDRSIWSMLVILARVGAVDAFLEQVGLGALLLCDWGGI